MDHLIDYFLLASYFYLILVLQILQSYQPAISALLMWYHPIFRLSSGCSSNFNFSSSWFQSTQTTIMLQFYQTTIVSFVGVPNADYSFLNLKRSRNLPIAGSIYNAMCAIDHFTHWNVVMWWDLMSCYEKCLLYPYLSNAMPLSRLRKDPSQKVHEIFYTWRILGFTPNSILWSVWNVYQKRKYQPHLTMKL